MNAVLRAQTDIHICVFLKAQKTEAKVTQQLSVDRSSLVGRQLVYTMCEYGN